MFTFYPFSKILYSVSFFRVRLSVRLRFRFRVGVRKPFSLIVRELLLSLTRLSFQLVRCLTIIMNSNSIVT